MIEEEEQKDRKKESLDPYEIFKVTRPVMLPHNRRPAKYLGGVTGKNARKRSSIGDLIKRIDKILKKHHKTLPIEEAVADILEESDTDFGLLKIHAAYADLLDSDEAYNALMKNLKSYLVKMFKSKYAPIITDEEELGMPVVEVEPAEFED